VPTLPRNLIQHHDFGLLSAIRCISPGLQKSAQWWHLAINSIHYYHEVVSFRELCCQTPTGALLLDPPWDFPGPADPQILLLCLKTFPAMPLSTDVELLGQESLI